MSKSNISFPSNCDVNIDFIFWILNGSVGTTVVLGNLLTCIVFLSSPYLRQNYMNIFLLSLAIADMLLGILVVPGYASFCDGCKYQWSRNCHILSPLKDFCLSAVILNLLAISHDRYTAVFKPLHYNVRMNAKRVGIILCIVWFIPVLVASLRILIHFETSEEHLHEVKAKYTTLLSVFLVLVPIIVLGIVNVMITRAVRRQRTRVNIIQSEFFSRNLSTVVQKRAAAERSFKRRKGTISCVLVVVLFVTCWLPRACFNLWTSSNQEEALSPVWSKLTMFLLVFQSSVNPFIYSIYRNEFRKAAKKVLFHFVCCIF